MRAAVRARASAFFARSSCLHWVCMGVPGTIGWMAIALSLVSCAELPWRPYAAAPPSPTRAALPPATARVAAPSVTLDATHEYSLMELIDLAQRANPDT